MKKLLWVIALFFSISITMVHSIGGLSGRNFTNVSRDNLIMETIDFPLPASAQTEYGCSDITIDGCTEYSSIGNAWNVVPFEFYTDIGRVEGEDQYADILCDLTNLDKFKNISGTLQVEWNIENIEPDFYDTCYGQLALWHYIFSTEQYWGYVDQYCNSTEVAQYCEGKEPPCGTYECTYNTKFENLAGMNSTDFKLTTDVREGLAGSQLFARFTNGDGNYNDKLLSPTCRVTYVFTECIEWPNSAPTVGVSVEPDNNIHTDMTVEFHAVIDDIDGPYEDKLEDYEIIYSGQTGTGDPVIEDTCVRGGDFPCEINITFPPTITRVDDNITVTIMAYDGEAWGSANAYAYVYNREPIVGVQSLTDFFQIYNDSDFVTYSDVFEQNLECVLYAVDPDPEHSQLDATIKIKIKPNGDQFKQPPTGVPGERRTEEELVTQRVMRTNL